MPFDPNQPFTVEDTPRRAEQPVIVVTPRGGASGTVPARVPEHGEPGPPAAEPTPGAPTRSFDPSQPFTVEGPAPAPMPAVPAAAPSAAPPGAAAPTAAPVPTAAPSPTGAVAPTAPVVPQEPAQTLAPPPPGLVSRPPVAPPIPAQQPSPAAQQPIQAAQQPVPTAWDNAKLFGAKLGEGAARFWPGAFDMAVQAQQNMPIGLASRAIQAGLGYAFPGMNTSGFNAFSNIPSAGALVDKAYAALGGPQPQTPDQQHIADVATALGGVAGGMGSGAILRAGASALPRGAEMVGRMLTAQPGMQVTGALGSAEAGDLARRAGFGERGQQIASLLGGFVGAGGVTGLRYLGRAARGLAGAYTKAGQKEMAREALLGISANPQDLQSNLAAGLAHPPDLPPGTPRTAGMVSRDPGVLHAEAALKQRPEGLAISGVEAARHRVMGETLESLRTNAPRSPGERGMSVRGAIQRAEDSMMDRVDEMYKHAKAGSGIYDTSAFRGEIQRIAREFYGPGGGTAPTAFRDIARQMFDRGARASNEWLINMRKQIGNEIGKAKQAGDGTLKGALGRLEDVVANVHASKEYNAATAYRRRVGEVLGRDRRGARATGDILAEDRYAAPRMDDPHVIERALRDKVSAAQVLDALDQGFQAARQSGASASEVMQRRRDFNHVLETMQDQFLENAVNRSKLTGQTAAIDPATGQSITHDVFNVNAWERYWTQNKEVADLIFPQAARDRLAQVNNLMRENAMATQTARKQGSPTAMYLSWAGGGESPTVGHILTAMTKGELAPESPAARIMLETAGRLAVATGGLMTGHIPSAAVLPATRVGNIFLRFPDRAVAGLIHDAMVDPQLYHDLISKASPATMARVLKVIQNKGQLGRLFAQATARAATGAAARPTDTATTQRLPEQ